MTTPPQDPYEYPIGPIGEQPLTHLGAEVPAPKPEPISKPRHRRWPWMLGIVGALVVGAYLGAIDEDASALATAERELATAERDLADLHLSLEGTQEQLAKVSGERDDALADLEVVRADRDATQEELAAAEVDRDEAITRAEEAEAALAATEGARAAAEDAQEAGADAEPAAQFGDGTWVVGEDIEAGVYRNDGGSLCYWERLSGLSGEFGDIIANGLPDGQAVVEIASSDAAFSSQGCGTWTRQ